MRFTLIGAVGQFVQHWFGVRPKPCQRPEQPAEAERKETEALDGPGLRVLLFLRDFFRQDVHEPENGDSDDRGQNEDDPGDEVGDGIQCLALKH